MYSPRTLAPAAAAVLLLTATPASAFEGDMQLGAGMGGAMFAGTDYGLGPLLGLHGSYGLSDMFDARLELAGSRHPSELDGDNERSLWLMTAGAGITYKLDVLEWVPYFGLLAGYHGATDPFFDSEGATTEPDQHGAFFAVPLGLDYLYSRDLSFGLELRYTGFASAPTDAQYVSLQLRVHYQLAY